MPGTSSILRFVTSLATALLVLAALPGCAPGTPLTPQAEVTASTPVPATASPQFDATATAYPATSTYIPTSIPTPTPTPTSLPPDSWQSLPVIPAALSERSREIYALGQELGNDARIFSRIGDCNSAALWHSQ